MTPTPLSPELRNFAATFSYSYAQILTNLLVTLARLFVKMPHLSTLRLCIPLYNRLSRTRGRIQRLMALLAAGRLPRPSRPGRAARTERPAGAPRPHFPTQFAWLIRTFGFEAAGLASQLRHQLAKPEMIELMAAVPALGRILRGPCRMLGISLLECPEPDGWRQKPLRPAWLAPPPVPAPPIRWAAPEPQPYVPNTTHFVREF